MLKVEIIVNDRKTNLTIPKAISLANFTLCDHDKFRV